MIEDRSMGTETVTGNDRRHPAGNDLSWALIYLQSSLTFPCPSSRTPHGLYFWRENIETFLLMFVQNASDSLHDFSCQVAESKQWWSSNFWVIDNVKPHT